MPFGLIYRLAGLLELIFPGVGWWLIMFLILYIYSYFLEYLFFPKINIFYFLAFLVFFPKKKIFAVVRNRQTIGARCILGFASTIFSGIVGRNLGISWKQKHVQVDLAGKPRDRKGRERTRLITCLRKVLQFLGS